MADRAGRWKRRRDSIYAWRGQYIERQNGLLKARQWQQARHEHIQALPHICSMLRMSTESWLQTLWPQLIVQYDTTDTKLMAMMMQRQMAIGGSSCLYRLQAIRENRHYEGLVQERPAGLRSREHNTATIDWQSRSELRYRYMFGKGGPGAWWFIPIVCSDPGTVHGTSQTA